MRLSCATIAAAAAFLLIAQPASAQDAGICWGLTGQARIDCLQDAYARWLKTNVSRACEAAGEADDAARVLHSRRDQRVRWAGFTWTSARDLASAARLQRGECRRWVQELRAPRRSR
jgi:hypothetical protein